MQLAGYQNEIANEIYDLLVMRDELSYINLYSTTGSGKTTIAKKVIEMLKENWMIFYIDGIDKNLSPYLTWFASTKLHSKTKMHYDAKLSFGVNFVPISYSFEFGIPHREPINYILTPSEEAILLDIQKQSGSNENILIVVDNYEQWDIPSKQLLQKLMLPQLDLLKDYCVNVLLLSNEKIQNDANDNWNNITIKEIQEDDILFILHQNGYAKNFDVKSIKSFAGNDLSLALMAGKYYDEGTSTINNVEKLLNAKIEHLCVFDKEICKMLESLSIIDSVFSQDEAAYFISSNTHGDIETNIKAEEYIDLAEKEHFIVGDETYKFINDNIKNFFYSKLSKKAKYLHRKFADYLSAFHPDDYFSRANHLSKSIWKSDPVIICEAWQMYFLAYVRIAFDFGWEDDFYQIIPKIKVLISQLPPIYAQNQTSIFKDCLEGYIAFSKYDYRKAIDYLQGISPMELCSAFRADLLRIVTLCHVQLAENIVQIQQSSADLFGLIMSDDFHEDEQYCRAALLLLDVYIDKSNDSGKVQILKRSITKLISKHYNLSSFVEFSACFNRKSALYYAANIALKQTHESVCFYRNTNNQSGLYMALCNQAANAIVSGDYDCAIKTIQECMELVETKSQRYYPSRYKVENNEILLSYLIDESNENISIIDAANRAREKFSHIISRDEDETSYVILLNYIALSVFCGTDDYKLLLKEANQKLTQVDEYYQYFLHDLNFIVSILNDDFNQAQKELDFLCNLQVPMFIPYEPIFRARRQTQAKILRNPNMIKKSPQIYDEIIKKECNHIQDSSHVFWGRGFLLSDLQFLSF